MPTVLNSPTVIECAGHPPKQIAEFVGRASTQTGEVSLARMSSPAGWTEPAQTPQFDEITYVLAGRLMVEHTDGISEVDAGQAVIAHRGERVRYFTPEPCEYVAICVPAFAPDLVNREG